MDQMSTPSRRAVVTLATMTAAAAATGFALADDKKSDAGSDAGSNDGEGHTMHMGGPAKHQALIDKALHCVNRGEVCVNHCIAELSTGKTGLKDCLATVSAMLPMCASLAKLAALDTPRLKEIAKVCAAVCDDCEKECRKHETHHEICKACAESCADCIKACKALTDA